MRAPFSIPLLVTVTAILLGGIAVMATADVDITKNGTKRCITSDGLPNHDTGAFLNRDNPHRISAQNVSVCVPTNPQKGSTPQEVRVPGIAINGVKIRPGTAYFYDASTPPSHSRNPASGWNLDGMGGRTTLGLDIQNAHVGPEGDYHCHGMPPALTRTSGNALTGLKFVMLGQTHGPAICCCPALGPRHPVVYTTVPIMRMDICQRCRKSGPMQWWSLRRRLQIFCHRDLSVFPPLPFGNRNYPHPLIWIKLAKQSFAAFRLASAS